MTEDARSVIAEAVRAALRRHVGTLNAGFAGLSEISTIDGVTADVFSALREKGCLAEWRPIEEAPKDGTWILGLNNRGNQAVIIWAEGLDRDELRMGWIHPFSDMRLSPFWNGACGSAPTHWRPLPPPPEKG